jgi:hypothetical protein
MMLHDAPVTPEDSLEIDGQQISEVKFSSYNVGNRLLS